MDDSDAVAREERGIYLVMLLAALPVVIGAAMAGAIDGGATLCGIVAVLAIAGLVRWRRSTIPHARARPRNSAPPQASRRPRRERPGGGMPTPCPIDSSVT